MREIIIISVVFLCVMLVCVCSERVVREILLLGGGFVCDVLCGV